VNIYEHKEIADNYGLLREIPQSIFDAYALKIVDSSPSHGAILDAGFGVGTIIDGISKAQISRNKGIDVYGIDSSASMKDIASKRLVRIANNATLIQDDLINYLSNKPEYFDIIHFKAILHCFPNPTQVIDAIDTALKPNGLVITGHEESQTEARIERLYRACPRVDDRELEYLLGYYFELRSKLAYKESDMGKTFSMRQFPAGDSSIACDYFATKGYTSYISSLDNEMEFTRKYSLGEVLMSIRLGSFGVFRDGLTDRDMEWLYMELTNFCNKRNIDLQKIHEVPARLRQYQIRKG